MTSLQMNMTVLNKRNGGSAAKAGSAFLDLTCLMGIVQRPVDGVDIKAGYPFWVSCLLTLDDTCHSFADTECSYAPLRIATLPAGHCQDL